jgi:hypothetical protein
MRKAVIFLILCLGLLLIADSPFARVDSEYATALKYYNRGNYSKAVTLLKEYVKRHPDASAYYRIGYALYELGRYDEANKYFEESYLVDPEYSFEVGRQFKKRPETEMPVSAPVPAKEKAPVSAVSKEEDVKAGKEVAALQAEAQKKAVQEVQALKPEAKIAPGPAKPAKPSEKMGKPPSFPARPGVTPPQKKQLPGGFQQFPMPEEGIPGMPTGLIALMATLGIIFQIAGLAFWIFFSLCLFLIGRKLQVRHSWIAWVPLLQNYWPLIGAAGKSLKWGLLYLLVLPLVGGILGAVFAMISPFAAFIVLFIIGIAVFIVYLYLWMLITENLGKNRWLGLLIIVPVVNIIWVAILAFSKTEKPSESFGDFSLT